MCFSWLLVCEGSGALLSIKLCEECGSNPCVCVFFIPWGHVNKHAHIWAVVTSMGSPDLNARFWLVETIFAALWLVRTSCSHYDYSSLFYYHFFNLKLQKFAISISQNFLRTEYFHELPCSIFFLLHGFEINLYLRKSCYRNTSLNRTTPWCWPLSLSSHLTWTMLSMESIFLSRVEGRGFHVEGEGTMSRVEGNIFFPNFFFWKR